MPGSLILVYKLKLGEDCMRFSFKPVEMDAPLLQPHFGWAIKLKNVVQDKSFNILDIKSILNITGEESMSLLSFLVIDARAVILEY
jgi:hypothetical protein